MSTRRLSCWFWLPMLAIVSGVAACSGYLIGEATEWHACNLERASHE